MRSYRLAQSEKRVIRHVSLNHNHDDEVGCILNVGMHTRNRDDPYSRNEKNYLWLDHLWYLNISTSPAKYA